MRALDNLPRAPLGLLPTPLEPAPRLAAALGGPPLFFKRDDLIGLALGGNKVRKLEYVLGDALAQGADPLITSAGLQSNRARMTATACRRVGLDCILLLCSNYGVNAPIGNLMLDDIFGAEVRLSAAPDSYSAEARAEAEQLADELALRGRRAYLTEVGGQPEPLAELGYFVGGLELARQCREMGVEPGAVLLATGSGGTQAGVLLGLRVAGLHSKVIGVSLGSTAAAQAARVANLAAHLRDWLELDIALEPNEIAVEDRCSATGHGPPDQASVEAVRLVARTEGVLIDPVYLAKVVLTLDDLIRQEQIDRERPAVLWHTGGAVAVFMHSEAFSEQPTPAAAGTG